MKLLIIDTETTGIGYDQDQVIEVGAILYSVPHRTTLFQISTLLRAWENPAEHINRIPSAVLHEINNETQQRFIDMLLLLAQEADFVIAHNAEFDKQWFDDRHLPYLTRQGKLLPWLCTLEDFAFPNQYRLRMNLVELALCHGIGVSSNHRALTDCQLIAALFDRMDALEEMIVYATRPKLYYRADVSFEDKGLAKDAGFKWIPESKSWIRRMAPEDAEQLPFQVTEVLQPEKTITYCGLK